MLNVLGVRVRVVGGHHFDRFRPLYPCWFQEDDGQPADAKIDFERGPDEEAALVDFQRRLDTAVLDRLSGFAVVHAGIVEVDGLLIVLPGRSGAGKSSFVSHLVRSGARYLSDEYAVIDPEGRAHAYPRPPMLRDAAGRNFLDRNAVAAFASPYEPRRPDVVLFLEFQATEASASLSSITSASAIMGLLRNTRTTWHHHRGLTRALAESVRMAAAYEGARGPVDVAWPAIRTRLTADGVRPHGL